MISPTLSISLPDWLVEVCAPLAGTPLSSAEARMDFTIGLARRNVEEGTGGPFAAAVFDLSTKCLVAPGVNMVTSRLCSSAHAEIVALSMAQQRLGNYDLGAPGMPRCELVSSTEPCAMCLGAVPWSGVRALTCGARGEDACAIGMDEGSKPADWVGELERRGIAVTRDICRDDAADVLRAYQASGGIIYNARQGG